MKYKNGWIITAYNFRRNININGLKKLKEYLRTGFSNTLEQKGLLNTFIKPFERIFYLTVKPFGQMCMVKGL